MREPAYRIENIRKLKNPLSKKDLNRFELDCLMNEVWNDVGQL
jgi:hypothetical protein